MQMQIKMKILAIHPKDRSVEVIFFTDALATDIEPQRVTRTAQLVAEGMEQDAARAKAEQEYVPGTPANLTLPDPIPQGQELIDYLMKQAPLDWLDVKNKQVVDPVDMTSVLSLQGSEFSKTVELLKVSDAAAIPVATP